MKRFNEAESWNRTMDQRQSLEPDDFYTDGLGNTVFTQKYLLKRGTCCKSGCRHCPYGFKEIESSTNEPARDPIEEN
jgi:hypothetical protein